MLDTARISWGKLGGYRRLLGLAREEAATPEAVQEAAPASTARVVCVASGKGGTGKSILASNLALVRARQGERVLLIDFDAGLANAHLLLGLVPEYDLSHVLNGEVEALEALVEGPGGIELLSGGVGRERLANPTRRELDRLFRALRPLEERFDLIIVDHGAGLGYGLLTQLAAAQALLLVTNHEVTALSDTYAVYKRAARINPTLATGLVVNRAPDEGRAQAAWERFRGAAERFLGRAPTWVGTVPADSAVTRSVEKRVPVCMLEPESEAARAISDVASWPALEEAQTGAFFDRAREALR